MGRNFELRDDVIRATFAPVEVELLVELRDQLEAALIASDENDPAVQRLFPTAVLGDPDADKEVRALLRADLLAVRLEGLDELIDVLERGEPHRGGLRVDLVDDEALLVLGVLNDLRLSLGAWMDIDTLERHGPLDDETAYRLEVMDHLAWMQEELLAIVDPESVSHYAESVDVDEGDDEP